MDCVLPESTITEQHHRAKFTQSEDTKLKRLVKKYGATRWEEVADEMPQKNARQCKERWMNCLDPNINKAPWSEQEDNLLLLLHKAMGEHWTKMAVYFSGRTDVNLKNRWTLIRKWEKLKKGDTKRELSITPAEEIFSRSPEEDKVIQDTLFSLF